MLTNQSDLAFNLTLEILQGCGYKCVDCAIDQSLTSDFVRENDQDGLVRLVDEMKAQGYRLHELTLGPTDIISSQSGIGILRSPLVVALAQRYSSLTVSLALLFDRQLQEFAEAVEALIPGKKLRIIVPLTLKNAGNEKFLNLIRVRLQTIQRHLTTVQLKLVYLTINMVGASAEQFSLESNAMAQEIDLGVEKLIEYAFPHSRKGLDNLVTRLDFLRDFKAFTDGMHDCKDTRYNRYLIPTISDSVETTYHRGELYYTPVLMEKFPIFDNKFIIDRPWAAETMMDYKNQLYYDSLVEFSDHPACGDCCFMDNCARGDTQLIMGHLNREQCLLDMKNRWDLNPSTNPVRPDE